MDFSQDTISASKFEDSLYEMPQKLGKRAYISDYILPLLPIKEEKIVKANCYLNTFITKEYISSFLEEFNATCLKDIPIIDSQSILPHRGIDEEQYISYNKLASMLTISKYKDTNALDFVSNCSALELIEFKHSKEWESVLEKVGCEKMKQKNVEKEKKMDEYRDIKIGIITALPQEFAAMKMMLQEAEECFFEDKGAGHRFFVGKVKSANGKTHRVTLGLCNMGNNEAATRATNMLNHFKQIDSIIMTGIAGGIPSFQNDDKQVRLGDIVVSESVIQYDNIKRSEEKEELRSIPTKASSVLMEAVKLMKAYEYDDKYPWREYLNEFASKPQFAKPADDTDKLYDSEDNLYEHPYDASRTAYPKIFVGTIASANTLLKNQQKRDELKEKHGALAVEMEASGIANAAWNNGTGYLIVRGICDYL